MITATDNGAPQGAVKHQPDSSDDAVGLFDIWALARRRKWLIVFGVILGVGLAYLYYSQATPIYVSRVQILVMKKDTRLPAEGAPGSEMDGQRGYGQLLATHMAMLQSPRVVGHAVETQGLDKLPTLREENAVNYIIRNLEVHRGGIGDAREANVLRISFQSPSADDAATILSAVVESYRDFLGQTFQDTSDEAVTLISQLTTELGEDLAQQEEAYRKFREESPLLWRGQQASNIHQERLVKIEQDLTDIQQQYLEIQARMEVIDEALDSDDAINFTDLDRLALLGRREIERLSSLMSATGSMDSLMWPMRSAANRAEFDKLLQLLLEERSLLLDYGPDHRQVQRVREQIALVSDYLAENAPRREVDERLKPADLLAAHRSLLRHDLAELEKRRNELEALALVERRAARELFADEVRAEQMRTRMARTKDVYETGLARLREINLIKDYGGFITEVIAPVTRASGHTYPRLSLSLAVGGILGLFFGCGLAYVVDLADRTFRNPDELHHALNLPVIAHVPSLVTRNGSLLASKQRANGAAGGHLDSTLLAHHRPKSREAETFRGLRTSLYFSAHGSGHKVIQVTSPNMGDGKSTVAANLAISMAQSGKKVLLVDCDLRRPRMAKLFGLKADTGLSNVIVGEAELSDAIKATSERNLWLLPSGPQPPNPSELLTLPKFAELLEVTRNKLDFILLDTPPLLVVSDPSVVAARVDGVLLTVRITRNGRPQVVRAKQMLEGLGTEILGVVVNRSNARGDFGYADYGYGSYGRGYGYGYGYDYSSRNKKADEYYAET